MLSPPFIGKKEQNEYQKKDLELVFKGAKGTGVLDYVACWYIKAAQLIQNTKTKSQNIDYGMYMFRTGDVITVPEELNNAITLLSDDLDE